MGNDMRESPILFSAPIVAPARVGGKEDR